MREVTAACPSCRAPAEGAGNFCIRCGTDLRGRGAAPPDGRDGARGGETAPERQDQPPPAGPRILACPRCGAVNAASRLRCGRCAQHLHEAGEEHHAGQVPTWADEPPEADGGSRRAPRRGGHRRRQRRRWMAAAALLLVVALVLAGGALLLRRGLDDRAAAPDEPVPLDASATASSSLRASGGVSYGAGNLFDGDPSTAWNEAADGPGRGEWVELRLAEPAEVVRLLVWNGHQKGALYSENARVRSLRIEVGERSFTVQLIDTRGPQAVDLPEPVQADSLRLTIEDVYPGTRYDDAALSELQVLVRPQGARPQGVRPQAAYPAPRATR